VDKNNGNFFWYNLKDEHSFWMSAEDQKAHRRVIAQGLDNTEEDSIKQPSHIPPPSNGRSHKGKNGSGGNNEGGCGIEVDTDGSAVLSYKELRKIKKSH
jgi:hypothetical protein